MKIEDASFLISNTTFKKCPQDGRPEFAFIGRSNVGKSSLVNVLTGRNTLARTSQTPGRTRQLIFFSLAARLQLVDLPGYGYAKAAKTDIRAWTKLTRKFLVGRQSLQRMLLLIDSRRGIGSADKEMMKLMDESAVSWAVVLTKMDKLKSAQAEKIHQKTQQDISRHVAAFPHVWSTSSQTGAGIAELRAHLASLSLPPTAR